MTDELKQLIEEAQHEMRVFDRPSKRTSQRMIDALTTITTRARDPRIAELEAEVARLRVEMEYAKTEQYHAGYDQGSKDATEAAIHAALKGRP